MNEYRDTDGVGIYNCREDDDRAEAEYCGCPREQTPEAIARNKCPMCGKRFS
jgi:hypothetical protein